MIGAWGRGEISKEFPLTPERTRMKNEIKAYGHHMTRGMGKSSDWASFGEDNEFWIDILLSRMKDKSGKIAVPNARFPNEVNRLCTGRGFDHFHVMCSHKTRRKRHEEEGEEMDDGIPPTERFAAELDVMAGLDNGVTEITMADDLIGTLYSSIEKTTNVIWNDRRRPPQSTNTTSISITQSRLKQLWQIG